MTISSRLGLLLLVAAGSLAVLPAHAWARPYHHRFSHRMAHRYYHVMWPDVSSYGTYPNIRYFSENGHVYCRNLDSGESYLVR